jgi:hypothetical protein
MSRSGDMFAATAPAARPPAPLLVTARLAK